MVATQLDFERFIAERAGIDPDDIRVIDPRAGAELPDPSRISGATTATGLQSIAAISAPMSTGWRSVSLL